MMETLQFGQPPSWAYPTIGSLQATGTPLPEQVRVMVYGRADQRIDIDETLMISDKQTKNEMVVAALIKAGDYNIEDFVETYVTIADGRAHVVGYVIREEHIREKLDAWSDDIDDDILESFIVDRGLDYANYDLSIQRL